MPVVALLLALAMLVVAAPVRAETVTVEPSAGCGDRAEIVADLAARLPGSQFEAGSNGPIRIVFVTHPGKVVATLELLLEDGSSLTREIAAGACSEAQEAIVFVAAVALDPDADDPIELRAPEPLEEDDPAERPLDPEPASSPRWRWGIGASGRGLFGPAPAALVGGELHVSLTPEHSGWWAPSIRLGLSYQQQGGFELPTGTAAFSAWLSTLDLCPSHLLLGRVSARVCGEVVAGVLTAKGKDTYEPAEPAPRPWVALGGSALVGLRLAPMLWLGLRGSIETPLVRDWYTFDGDAYYEVPALGGAVSGGLEVRFR